MNRSGSTTPGDTRKTNGSPEPDQLEDDERYEARRRMAPKAANVYEAIRKEGEIELDRNTTALLWSGIGAGLSMGFSFLMETLLV